MAKAADAKGAPPRRTPPRRLIIAVAAVVLAVLAGWLLWRGHRHKSEDAFTGYVVSDDIYMASPISGTLSSISVRRGDRVTAGQALFRVDPTVRAAQADQARAAISAGQAQVAQQEAARTRAAADLAAAQADADRTGAEAQRLAAAQREKHGAVAQLQLDQAMAAWKAAQDKRDGARAALQSAAAGADAARAQLRQSQAGLTSAERQLSDLAPVAPGPGRVDDVMYKPGETVAANAVVVSITPDGEVKVRFFVPEAKIAAYRPGRRVAIACDGCAGGMTAVVDFVASRPEYTPPVIYSLDARQKLVFMVEAVPSDPRALAPGQPIDVGATAADLRRR